MYGTSDRTLSTKTVLSYLNSHDCLDHTNLSKVPPSRPSAGSFYIYLLDNTHLEDWKADGYVWINKGPDSKLKKMNIKKTRFYIRTMKTQYDTGFSRISYELVERHTQDSCVVVQYVGDETLYIPRPHGNSVHRTQPHLRTAPSTLKTAKDLVMHETASVVYKKQTTNVKIHDEQHGVLTPNSVNQLKYLRQSVLKGKRISNDPICNLLELYFLIPGFVHDIRIVPHLYCVVGLDITLKMVNDILKDDADKCVFGYDTTYLLGDYYLSLIVLRHPYLENNPIFPVAALLHERKFGEVHHSFLETLCKVIPRMANAGFNIVMDRERALSKAVENNCKNAHILICWNHLLRDAEEWAKKRSSTEDATFYKDAIRNLLQSRSPAEYQARYKKTVQWSTTFRQYYEDNLEEDILKRAARFILQPLGVYSQRSGITNNASESYNNVVKTCLQRRETYCDNMIVLIYKLQAFSMVELRRAVMGRGSMTVIPQHKTDLTPESCVKFGEIMDIDDLIANIKSGFIHTKYQTLKSSDTARLPTTTGSHATAADALSCTGRTTSQHMLAVSMVKEQRIMYVENFDAYMVIGESGVRHTVTMRPKQSCTCYAARKCCHIMAALIVESQYEESKIQQLNLASLKTSVRRKTDKVKAGRKRPRKNDLDPENSVHKKNEDSQIEFRKPTSPAPRARSQQKVMAAIKRPEASTEEFVENFVNINDDSDDNESPKEMWVAELNLPISERVVIEEDGWLTDEGIDAFLQLLRKQFPLIGGMQYPGLMPYEQPGNQQEPWRYGDHTTHVGRYDPATSNNTLQLHHTHHGHWVMSARYAGSTDIYLCDSLSSKNHGNQSDSIDMQLAQLYASGQHELTVTVPRAAQQDNGQDCGLYAMAFATSFCLAVAAGDVRHFYKDQYDQSKMRDHLIKIFDNHTEPMEPFPLLPSCPLPVITPCYHHVISLECKHCNMPRCYNPMHKCEGCQQYLHEKCAVKKSPGLWLCLPCSASFKSVDVPAV